MDINSTIVEVNKILSTLEKERVVFIDLHKGFSNKYGKSSSAYFRDGIHLKPSGYLYWKSQISEFVDTEENLTD